MRVWTRSKCAPEKSDLHYSKETMETVHQSNIALHVLTGTASLALGLIALLSAKGGKVHNKSGNYFLAFLSVVIITGLLGVFVFGRNTFLLVITVLTGYVAFSGYRGRWKFKSNVPRKLDMIVAVISLSTLAYFLYFFPVNRYDLVAGCHLQHGGSHAFL